MPSFDDFLYEESDLTLITMIKQNQSAEASKYILKKSVSQHDNQVFNPSQEVQMHLQHLSLQINENPRQRIVITHPSAQTKGQDHIFSQSKKEWKAAIHFAAEKGMTDVVRLLIEKAKKSNLEDYVNIKDGYGRTPLHYAAMGGHEELMQFLVRSGADPKEKEASRSQAPWELMDRSKNYSPETLRLMSSTFSASSIPSTNNPLYEAIRRNDEALVKQMVFNEELFRGAYSRIQETRETVNLELTKYINFARDLHAIRGEYHTSLMKKFSSEEEKNLLYLNLLKRGLDVSSTHNIDEAAAHYNSNATMQLMRLMGACVNNISYGFRDKSYEAIPWQNLESLMHVVSAAELDKDIGNLLQIKLGDLCNSFRAVRDNLSAINADGSVNTAFPIRNEVELKPIYLVTDIVSDLRSLERIASFSDIVHSIDTKNPNSEGRLALLTAVKQLGEFSKHSNQCRNLSPVAKEHFYDIPWKILEGLRDHVAKSPSRPKTRPAYDDLIQNVDDRLLLRIRSDIADISVQAKAAHLAIKKEIIDDGWDKIILAYSAPSNATDLSAEQKNELIDDLKKEVENVASKKQKEKKAQIVRDIEDYFKDPLTANSGIPKDLQEKIFGNFFKSENDPNKKKWKDIFDGRSGAFKGLEDCYDKFESSRSSGIDHRSRANMALNKMIEIIVSDTAKADQLKANPNLEKQPHEVQKHLTERFEAYNSSPKLRMAVEQVFSELWLLLNHLGPTFEMSENNTKMRNFIEHRNNIFDSSDRDLDKANFFEFLGAILETNQKLNPVSVAPVASIQPSLGLQLSNTNTNTVILGNS